MKAPKNKKSHKTSKVSKPLKPLKPPTLYYVMDAGSGNLDLALSHEHDENSGRVTVHPGMFCLDRRGKETIRYLWEISEHLLIRIQKRANLNGFSFVIYSGLPGEMPKEQEAVFPKKIDPFVTAHKRRKRLAKKLPKGVIRGSALLRS